jgi:hypothetical protein
MPGGIFISYRREDSAGFAGRIYDRLTTRLARERVFFDVDNIEPGLDFVKILSDRVADCDALVAIIGRDWLAISDGDNQCRLDDPHDFVRIEIEAALKRNTRVIPVLVDGATMPKVEVLPDGLKALAHRQGIEISHSRFNSDVERLTKALAFVEEQRRNRDAADAERAVREQREKQEIAEAAKKAEEDRKIVEAAAARAADEERLAREDREKQEAADAVRKAEKDRKLAEAAMAEAVEERRLAREAHQTKEAADKVEKDRRLAEATAAAARNNLIEAEVAERTPDEQRKMPERASPQSPDLANVSLESARRGTGWRVLAAAAAATVAGIILLAALGTRQGDVPAVAFSPAASSLVELTPTPTVPLTTKSEAGPSPVVTLSPQPAIAPQSTAAESSPPAPAELGSSSPSASYSSFDPSAGIVVPPKPSAKGRDLRDPNSCTIYRGDGVLQPNAAVKV